MIATVYLTPHFAFKMRECPVNQRQFKAADPVVYAMKFVAPRAGKNIANLMLLARQDIYRKGVRLQKMLSVPDCLRRLQSTSGGSVETVLKLLMVSPWKLLSLSIMVTTHTPVAN